MMDEAITIPIPIVAPFGSRLDKPEYVREVWDAFVVPEQKQAIPQSVEMRMLMAILRAVYDGLGGNDVDETGTSEQD